MRANKKVNWKGVNHHLTTGVSIGKTIVFTPGASTALVAMKSSYVQYVAWLQVSIH